MRLHLLGRAVATIVFAGLFTLNCKNSEAGGGGKPSASGTDDGQKMAELCASIFAKQNNPGNFYNSKARVEKFLADLAAAGADPVKQFNAASELAQAYLELGDEQKAVDTYEGLFKSPVLDAKQMPALLKFTGVAYLRLAERTNCVMGHMDQSCIMPIQGNGVHVKKEPARKAVEMFERMLTEYAPDDLDARWLLNIAYMTLGEYPGSVPAKWLVKGLDAKDAHPVKPFADLAADLGTMLDDRSGGSILEDFDNDGDLDYATSTWALDESMHFFVNNGDGTFTDRTAASGLGKVTGGLNMTTTDYNNDGFIDIFVLRGAWQGQIGYGEQPNSLLKNNGDGTFSDVTIRAGLLSLCPTQTATWNDFNNDGWLDVFIGNETTDKGHLYPCELYMNNHDGTFTNIGGTAELNITVFAKGVTSGDYDNDGWPDIFISALTGNKILLRNAGIAGPRPQFAYVSVEAGLAKETGRTFPTWFFDYDNDGWLDIFCCNYEFERPLSYYACREALKPSDDWAGKPYIFRNNHVGGFTNMSKRLGLNHTAFAMGSNFGDIDNDGWLDFYLSTGNPNYQSLIPNKLFHNIGGERFDDVSNSSRTASLQKGHAVSIADLDNDGDQDINTDLGGAFQGDHYPSALYINPGQNDNNFIYLKLVGTTSNRAAIGANVTVKFTENGKQRMVYREVNPGGSFGSSTLRREIGIGKAAIIDEIVVKWPASKTVQTFKNIQPNQFLKITEGKNEPEKLPLNKMVFKRKDGTVPMCN